MSKYTRAYA